MDTISEQNHINIKKKTRLCPSETKSTYTYYNTGIHFEIISVAL